MLVIKDTFRNQPSRRTLFKPLQASQGAHNTASIVSTRLISYCITVSEVCYPATLLSAKVRQEWLHSPEMKIRVLFLCATNGVQSPMAEALLNRLDSAHFDVTSAGIDRGEMHPLAIEVMKEVGIDLEGRVPQRAHDVLNQDFDFVITVCDRAKAAYPEFPRAELVYWRFDDPFEAMEDTERKRMFQLLRDQIAHRLRLFALVQVRFAPIEKQASRRSAVSV